MLLELGDFLGLLWAVRCEFICFMSVEGSTATDAMAISVASRVLGGFSWMEMKGGVYLPTRISSVSRPVIFLRPLSMK